MQGCKSFIPSRRQAGRLALILGFLPCAGCLSLDKDAGKKPPVGPIHQVQSFWSKEVKQINQGASGNGTPLAGLGGRVYLFGPELKYPLAAQGQATIAVEMSYLRPDNNQTQRIEWKFTKKELDPLLSKDYLGWGYTIPLPWFEYQPGIKQVTIKVAYIPEKSQPIVGSPSTFTLGQGVRATARQIPVLPDAPPSSQPRPAVTAKTN